MSIPYFYPAQPTRIWPNTPSFRSLAKRVDKGKWIAELKYNGWRLLIHVQDDDILFYNRHGKIISANTDCFKPLLAHIPNGTIFDAELVDKRTKTLKNIVILFDCPFFNGEDQRKRPLFERQRSLELFDIAPRHLENLPDAQMYRIEQHTVNAVDLYNQIEREHDPLIEGLVLKDLTSPYGWHPSRGKDVIYWQKVKMVGDHAMVV